MHCVCYYRLIDLRAKHEPSSWLQMNFNPSQFFARLPDCLPACRPGIHRFTDGFCACIWIVWIWCIIEYWDHNILWVYNNLICLMSIFPAEFNFECLGQCFFCVQEFATPYPYLALVWLCSEISSQPNSKLTLMDFIKILTRARYFKCIFLSITCVYNFILDKVTIDRINIHLFLVDYRKKAAHWIACFSFSDKRISRKLIDYTRWNTPKWT